MNGACAGAKHGVGRRPRARPGWRGWILVLLVGLAGCRAARTRDKAPFVLEIEARNRHLEQQFRAGNLLGVADVYADDAVLLNARGERIEGREGIDGYWSAIENPVDWSLEIRTIRGSEAVAYELGVSRLTKRRDGQLITSETSFLVLWRREPDGAWRIALDAYWPLAR